MALARTRRRQALAHATLRGPWQGGALCYSINGIIARQAPRLAPTVMPVGFVTVAALCSVPMLFWTDWSTVTLTPESAAAVIGLGAVSTGLAGIILIFLVSRTSATFIALTGYVIPILSAIIGFFAFQEVQSWSALGAFVLILSGVWFSQRQRRRAPGQA